VTRQWWAAPAKLNLFLHVTGRRADGYHLLQTVFQLIDLSDELEFEVTDEGLVTRVDDAAAIPPEGVAPDDDLCVRAARALQGATGSRLGARIRVRKRIPLGGGLGGGSSDAATTLRVLDKLWGTAVGLEALSRIGVQLGADVPVFVRGRSAWAEGVGEVLTPLNLPGQWFVVIHPGVSVPTRDVFQAPELTRNSPLITIRAPLGPVGRNDCEPVVRARFPPVAEALDWLEQHAPARLTGTGACVFAGFATAALAERVAARVPDAWRAWVARGLSTTPLEAQLAERFPAGAGRAEPADRGAREG
jgi:4-diphosphocytidyl-2-C-methyl-D-erythritol kinase